MKLTYFNSPDSTRKPLNIPANQGIESVPDLLEQLKAQGCDVEFVDVSSMNESERFDAYKRVAAPAIYKHYEVKRVLGTNRRSACWFGAEVPALLVTDSDSIGDSYPHRKQNRITTIQRCLTALLASQQQPDNV